MQSKEVRHHIDNNPKTSSLALGQYKIKCPNCSDQRRKNKSDTPLSVKIEADKIIYHCFHCELKGIISRTQGERPMKIVPTKESKQKPIKLAEENSDKAIEWLADRGISWEVAEKHGVVAKVNKKYLPVIGFTYASENGSDYEAIKWRSANGKKDFWWDNNASKLWGNYLEDEKKETIEDTVVITEGEMDALAIAEAFKDFNIRVYSVPNGSPNKISEGKVDPSEDGRFKYVWNDREKLDGFNKIILASDCDEAGDCLVHELSRRLGKEKCYRVDYKGYKDANELLLNTNAVEVRKQILNAQPIPLHGLNSIDHYQEEWQSLYDQGEPSGISTGIKSLDDIVTLQTGQLYVLTGYAGHGKSAFLDQLVVNAGKMYGWKTCFASFEKPPTLHAIQLAQILTGKSFYKPQYVGSERMSQHEKDDAQAWITEHILFQDYMDGGLPTISAVLEKAKHSIQRNGTRIVCIDPFNFIHAEKTYALETDMVSEMLTKVQLFAKQHDVLVIFVAHPSKPMDKSGKVVPNLLDVAKSMAWSTKPDVGLTVHRGEDGVEIHCTKARWYWNAQLGRVMLNYNPSNGRYEEYTKKEDDFNWEF